MTALVSIDLRQQTSDQNEARVLVGSEGPAREVSVLPTGHSSIGPISRIRGLKQR